MQSERALPPFGCWLFGYMDVQASDVDWEKSTIRWRGENDKIGFEHVTPLPPAAKEAPSQARKVQVAIGDS